MPNNPRIAEFPDVEAKLQQTRGQSAFERQKAEAEAKRKREAAETAAVYQDFVKSFDDDGDDDDFPPSRSAYSRNSGPGSLPDRPAFGNQAPYGGGGRRHFGAPPGHGMKSGPGSLGPLPMSFGKKRTYDGFPTGQQRDRDESRVGKLGYEERDSALTSVSRAFDASEDEEEQASAADRAEEKAISKPTLRLANLPPATSPAMIKALIPSTLVVDHVRIVPITGPVGTERRSITAIVTLSKESPATEIDAAVSALQNHYLGFGFHLSLHRHLSSAAITAPNLPAVGISTPISQPFGARRITEEGPSASQPVGFGPKFSRSFAPPTSYGPPGGGPVNKANLMHVAVQAPRDIRRLRMIHKVVELVLEHGPEFEALLMSRPDVQRDEKWSWIWDARSEGGIWYRWRLWEIITGSSRQKNRPKYLPLFENSYAWKIPDRSLAYEFTTSVDGFVSESEYNSSDQDDFDDEPHGAGDANKNDKDDTFLNPIEKANLVHLLARLPRFLTRLRKGDIARITTFAITHASRGADEIVDLIVSNIEKPLSYTSANPDLQPEGGDKTRGEDGDEAADEKANSDTADTSAARLLALYVVSDILSCASTSGIRHAWRYRQLLETALRHRNIFETLGALPTTLAWGRLRAEKWKRSVGLVLGLWESWCVFPIEAHESFVKSFEDPPVLRKEAKADETERKGGKWKTVEAVAARNVKASGFRPVSDQPGPDENVESLDAEEEDDGSPYETYSEIEYSELDTLLAEESLDGTLAAQLHALLVSVDGDTALEGGDNPSAPASRTDQESNNGAAGPKEPSSRKRMRAVDMFADSGSDGES